MHRTPALLLLLGACSAPEELDQTVLGLEEDDTGLIQDLRGATYDRPCAEKTVARVRIPNGNTMTFCVLDFAKEVFLEIGPYDGRSYFEQVGITEPQRYCALDLYMAVTSSDTPLPVELLEACPPEGRTRSDYDRRRQVRGGYFEEAGVVRSHFCASDGKATFLSECYECDPYDDCIDWCQGDPKGWHQKTMTSQLGEEGNVAIDRTASCSGSTRIRGWDRDDYGDAWGSPDYDFMLGSGSSVIRGFIYHSIWLFGEDYDFRMRADSNSGAWHRYTGYFLDE